MAELLTTALFNHANLQAYYRFNSGALTTDSKGSFTLTNNNSVGETTDGKYGNGADFGASNTNKTFYRNGAIGSGGERTIAMWAKRHAELTSGNNEMIHFTHASNYTQFQLRYYRSGADNYFTLGRHIPSVTIDYGTPYKFAMGTDYHLVFLERSNANNTMKLYLDGNQATPVINYSVSGGATGATDYFQLGSSWDSAPASMKIDECAVFNAVLTEADRMNMWRSVTGGQFLINFL